MENTTLLGPRWWLAPAPRYLLRRQRILIDQKAVGTEFIDLMQQGRFKGSEQQHD